MANNRNYFSGIFSVPFLHTSVDNWNVKKSEILNLKSSGLVLEKNEYMITDFWSKNRYTNLVEKILKKEILDINQFFGLSDHYVRESWIEISDKNMCHPVHTHGPFGISAVCFVEYDENEHTPTVFLSQYLDYLSGQYPQYIPPNITEGSLIAFPSNINHFTFPNKSDIPRTILSFNLAHISVR